jgi:hypothetical protein
MLLLPLLAGTKLISRPSYWHSVAIARLHLKLACDCKERIEALQRALLNLHTSCISVAIFVLYFSFEFFSGSWLFEVELSSWGAGGGGERVVSGER